MEEKLISHQVLYVLSLFSACHRTWINVPFSSYKVSVVTILFFFLLLSSTSFNRLIAKQHFLNGINNGIYGLFFRNNPKTFLFLFRSIVSVVERKSYTHRHISWILSLIIIKFIIILLYAMNNITEKEKERKKKTIVNSKHIQRSQKSFMFTEME